MSVYDVPAQDELDAQVDRLPLPGGEDYIAEIIEVAEVSKPNFDGVITDQLTVKFNIESFADGAPLEDIKQVPVEGGRWAWKDFDPKRMGFQQNGTPSLTRQFFAAASGISDVSARIEGVDTVTLVGNRVVLALVVKPNKAGVLKNNITAIKTLKKRRGAAPSPRVAQATVSPEYARAVAELVNGGDASDDETEAVAIALGTNLPF